MGHVLPDCGALFPPLQLLELLLQLPVGRVQLRDHLWQPHQVHSDRAVHSNVQGGAAPVYALLTASLSLMSRTNRAASARASSAALRHATHPSHSISFLRVDPARVQRKSLLKGFFSVLVAEF